MTAFLEILQKTWSKVGVFFCKEYGDMIIFFIFLLVVSQNPYTKFFLITIYVFIGSVNKNDNVQRWVLKKQCLAKRFGSQKYNKKPLFLGTNWHLIYTYTSTYELKKSSISKYGDEFEATITDFGEAARQKKFLKNPRQHSNRLAQTAILLQY